MSLSKKTILVLGGGYIGNKLVKYLLSLGANVVGISASEKNYHDKKTLWRLLLNEEPNVVINCSGFTGRPNIDEAESKKEECWEYNVRSPLQVAQLCSNFGVKHIHISSGCVYTGYDKEFTEEDTPNFGLWDESSTYSKTKHAFEYLSKSLPSKILRIRMPISGDSPRCYLTKIRNYDKLINYRNSKTYIPELCEFIVRLIQHSTLEWKKQDIYNIVNNEPLYTEDVCQLMEMANLHNPKWTIVDIDKIPIVAPRSNCILDNTKASNIMPLMTEREALWLALGLHSPNPVLGSEK